jgi:hypothetical protein
MGCTDSWWEVFGFFWGGASFGGLLVFSTLFGLAAFFFFFFFFSVGGFDEEVTLN